MQYDLDTITGTNGNATIVGGPNVDWTSFLTGASYFLITGTNNWWRTVAVRKPVQNASGRWELDLNGPFAGAPSAAAWTTGNYILGNGFTPNLQLPLLSFGDGQGNSIYTQAMLLLDMAHGEVSGALELNKQLVTLQQSQTFQVVPAADESYLLKATFAPFVDPRPLVSTLKYTYAGGNVYPSPSAEFNNYDATANKSVVGWHIHVPGAAQGPYTAKNISFTAVVEGRNFSLANLEAVPTLWTLDPIP